jgi:hypothetical protein
MTNIAICQDCCRVHKLDALIPSASDPPGLCPACNGQTCNCHECIASIASLDHGDWHSSMLQPHAAARVISWTPEGGLIMRREAA